MGKFFPHLHIHDEHSIKDGCATVESYADTVCELGGGSLAITNHGMAAGFARQYFACKDRGIKPIFGMEAYLNEHRLNPCRERKERLEADAKRKKLSTTTELEDAKKFIAEKFRPSSHSIILAKNRTGYKNLVRMSTDSFVNGYYYVPRTDTKFLEDHAEGLVYSTACIGGYIPKMARTDYDAAVKEAKRLKNVFQGNFYVEIMMTEYPMQAETNLLMLELAKDVGAPCIITCDVHYSRPSDSLAQDTLLLMRDKKTIADKEAGEGIWQFESKDLYWRTLEDVVECWKKYHSSYFPKDDFKRAIKNTYRLADSIEGFDFDTSIKLPGVFDEPEYTLKEMVKQGIRRRKDHGLIPASGRRLSEYVERVKRELAVIERKGFSEYFIILADICQHARDIGGTMGPGRGSAGGSLVSYLLRITEVDPLKFNLLFERFLDETRPDPPDIDLDFSPTHRESIKQYIQERYPTTASISTFSTFKPRATMQDVGRVFGVPYQETQRITKEMGTDADKMDWPEIFELWPEAERWADQNPEAFRVAKVLKGLISHRSKSAAGVLIAPEGALDEVPLMTDPKTGALITAFPDPQGDGVSYKGREITRLGYLKMDILGLMNLDVNRRAIEIVSQNRGVEIDLLSLPLDDPETLETAESANVPGVFQLDTVVSRPILKTVGVDGFMDLVMTTALARPGPLKNEIHKHFARLKKSGDKWKEDVHPDLEDLLYDSRGLMILQEDIMHVVQVLGGLSMTDSYRIMKISAKKLDEEAFAPYKKKFIDGGVALGNDKEMLESTWEKMLTFSKYSFNKAHSVAYMMTAYWQLYLLTHYPTEYFAALLSETPRNKETSRKESKIASYIRAAMTRGIKVVQPSVYTGGPDFTVRNGRITFGYSKIKGVSTRAEHVAAAAPYESFEDFYERVERSKVNKKVVEALIYSGSFDDMPFEGRDESIQDLEQPIEVRNLVMKRFLALRKNKKDEYQEFLPMTLMAKEVDLVSFPVSWWSSELVDRVRSYYKLKTIVGCKRSDKSRFHIIAEVTSLRKHKSKSGTMAFMSVADDTGTLNNIIIWANQWRNYSKIVAQGKMVVMRLRRQEADNPRYGRWSYFLDDREFSNPIISIAKAIRRIDD